MAEEPKTCCQSLEGSRKAQIEVCPSSVPSLVKPPSVEPGEKLQIREYATPGQDGGSHSIPSKEEGSFCLQAPPAPLLRRRGLFPKSVDVLANACEEEGLASACEAWKKTLAQFHGAGGLAEVALESSPPARLMAVEKQQCHGKQEGGQIAVGFAPRKGGAVSKSEASVKALIVELCFGLPAPAHLRKPRDKAKVVSHSGHGYGNFCSSTTAQRQEDACCCRTVAVATKKVTCPAECGKLDATEQDKPYCCDAVTVATKANPSELRVMVAIVVVIIPPGGFVRNCESPSTEQFNVLTAAVEKQFGELTVGSKKRLDFLLTVKGQIQGTELAFSVVVDITLYLLSLSHLLSIVFAVCFVIITCSACRGQKMLLRMECSQEGLFAVKRSQARTEEGGGTDAVFAQRTSVPMHHLCLCQRRKSVTGVLQMFWTTAPISPSQNDARVRMSTRDS